MIIKLKHNFSGVEYSLTITEITVQGNYYSFEIPFPDDAPYGEYNYKLMLDEEAEKPVSSGIINFSPYLENKYIVRDNILYIIYDAKN